MIKPALLAGLLLLVLVAIQQAPASPVAAVTSVQGDVNCGGTVNAVDALQVLRSVAGLTTSAACLPDAAYLLRILFQANTVQNGQLVLEGDQFLAFGDQTYHFMWHLARAAAP